MTEKSVHPRIRGERAGDFRMRLERAGSSPHTRGTLRDGTPGRAILRFIPAYAGNAFWGCSSAASVSVHPRIRGERCVTHSMCPAIGGSSPHTRGTHEVDAGRCKINRFIPAYAGNATGPAMMPREGPVHPRIRGERHATQQLTQLVLGSSPHTRGTRPHGPGLRHSQRFIPAYAGNALPISY